MVVDIYAYVCTCMCFIFAFIYTGVYVRIFPSSAMHGGPVAMRALSTQILVSKNHSPLKGIKPPWRNSHFQGCSK